MLWAPRIGARRHAAVPAQPSRAFGSQRRSGQRGPVKHLKAAAHLRCDSTAISCDMMRSPDFVHFDSKWSSLSSLRLNRPLAKSPLACIS